jgi:glycosyltransferase involved in cell wall biosynthesis
MPQPAKNTIVILPCLNEEESLPKVLGDLPVAELGLRVVVVDNGSTDRSAEVAVECGAEVVREEERGYGAACLRGMAEIDGEEFVVFLDADYSDHPEEVRELLAPLRAGEADFVLGSRMIREDARAALLPQARFGNRLASVLLGRWYGLTCTDLGPFRALTVSALRSLEMEDRGFGWTVEMQAKAGWKGLRFVELPVKYRVRVGKSKITGTLRGTLGASYKILSTLFLLKRRLGKRGWPRG